MKILHINRHYIGTELHHILVEKLDANGVEDWVFAPTSQKIFSKPYLTDRVKVVRCFRKIDRLFFHIKQNKIYHSLNKNFDVPSFDVIHAYTVFTDGYSAYRIFKKYGIPYVVAVRDTDVNGFFKKLPWLRSLGLKILKSAKRIYFLSETYKDEVYSKYVPAGVKELLNSKTAIVPNGIDDFWHENEYRFEKGSIGTSNVKLICVGRIGKRKNIPITQRAIEIIRSKGINCSLTLIGKIDEKSVYDKVIKDRYTRYIPPVNKEKLIDYYRDADIFVMPSLTETFGLVYVEAMSQGLPVVYSKGQGFDGQFSEGYVGFSADSGSPEDVAAKVIKIINNYNSIQKNVVGASRRYNWNNICKRYIADYENILEQRK